MLGSTLAIPFIISEPMCFANNSLAISEVLSTIYFVSGLVTLLQTLLGIRYVLIVIFFNYGLLVIESVKQLF